MAALSLAFSVGFLGGHLHMERSSLATSSSASEPARKYDGSVCCVVNSNNLLANAGGALNFSFFLNRHLIFLGGWWGLDLIGELRRNTSRSALSGGKNKIIQRIISTTPQFF